LDAVVIGGVRTWGIGVPRGPAAKRVILVEMTRTMVLPTRASDEDGAFERFFLDSCQLAVGMVAVTTGDVAAAEDAVLEAYLRAHQRWGRVGGLERPELWVVKVATRIAVSSWRRRRETQLGRELEAEVADSIARIWTRRGLEGLSPQQRLTAYPQEYVTRSAFCAAANLKMK